ncbi:MAG TPA: DUF3151 domain-containing protein [Dermatophilaceae bacterium]|nr:DUF3151 domain-containing protein [Dermatophilaceae bacterium]
MDNLMGIPETRLPVDPAAAVLAGGRNPQSVAAKYPSSPLAWATLAEEALEDGRVIEGYAFARTGYHRSLDALRRGGWKGQGPVPWSHEPNQGFLRSLAALSRAAGEIGETDEQQRCAQFLRDSSAEGASALGL